MRLSNTQPPCGTPLNKSHPLSQGLVGCWLFNEGGGQKAFEASGYLPTPMTLSAGAVFQNSAKGSCVTFNGTSSFCMSTENSNLRLTRSGTIIAWINIGTSPVTYGNICFKRTAGNPAGLSYGVDMDAGGNKIRGLISNGSLFNLITGSTSLSSNVWYHIAFTWDGANLNCYLNGVIDATPVAQVLDAQSVSTQLMTIGCAIDVANFYFKGLINSVFIYNRGLSYSEVRRHYTNSYQMFNGYIEFKKLDSSVKYSKFNNSGVRPRPFAPGHAR